MYFNANMFNNRFLWSQWNKADIKLYTGSRSVILDEEIYAAPRANIANRLKKHGISGLIAKINI